MMGYEFMVDNEDDLVMDLEKDPFISKPITAGLILAKDFKIKKFLPR